MNKETTIFIDTQDVEERYGEQLYQEYLEKENKELKEKVNQLETSIATKDSELLRLKEELRQLKTNIDEAIEYINKYAWQEDIIGDMYTTTGKPIVDRYMQLDWDSCNELLSLLERGKE